MNRTTHIIAAIGILLAFAAPALAITGTVNRIIIQAATDEELDETVLEPGLLVYRVADPKDVRIGDGMTAGGISLWNYLALTNPPATYDRDLDMDGHAIELNSHYRIVAEGGYLSIYHIGTNPVFRLVGSESAGTLGILESVTVGTNIVITVQHVEGDAPPVLEGATDIGDPVWTPVEYDLDRLSSVTVTLTFPQPETGVFTYYRVSTSVSEPMANFLVPLLVDGDPVLTAETDPAWNAASGSVVYATTPGYTAAVEQAATAYGWGDHAEEGYLTAEADAAALSAVAAVSGRVDTVEGWGDHADAGYLTDASSWSEHPATSTVDFGGSTISNTTLLIDSYGHALEFDDGTINFANAPAIRSVGGTNRWEGRINDTEASRISLLQTPATATNSYIRPDGGTNTIYFDAASNMVIAVDGSPALTISPAGDVGVGTTPSASFSLRTDASFYAGGQVRAGSYVMAGSGQVFLNSSGTSWLLLDGTNLMLRTTNGVTGRVQMIYE